MTINQELAYIVHKDKDLIRAFDGKSSYPSAMGDKHSFYPRIETGCLFTPNQETEVIQQLNNRTFTQFKDKASAILRVKYYNPKNLINHKHPLKKMLFWMEKN